MTMLFRALWILLTARWRGSLDLLGESVLSFRVMPGDLDVNLHMNNGRYLTLMDMNLAYWKDQKEKAIFRIVWDQ